MISIAIDVLRCWDEIIAINAGNEFKIWNKIFRVHIRTKEVSCDRVKMMGFIDNTRTPFDIDIEVGDIVIPKPSKLELESLVKEFSSIEILSDSLKSTISEKWDAIIDIMELNSMMKDFYDIYYLAKNYNFEGRKLQKVIFETLDTWGIVLEKETLDHVGLLESDNDFIVMWKEFTHNTLKIELDFSSVINLIIEFIGKPFKDILYEEELFLNGIKKKWNRIKQKKLRLLRLN